MPIQLKLTISFYSIRYRKYITLFDELVNKSIASSVSRYLCKMDEVQCNYKCVVDNSYNTTNTYYTENIPALLLKQIENGNKARGTTTQKEELANN